MPKASNLFEFFLLLMVAMNFQHGPHQDDARYSQVRDSVANLWDTMTPEACPLFAARGGDIAKELLGADTMVAGDSLAQAWTAANSLGLMSRKGYQVNLNRFLGVLSGAKELRARWHSTLFICEWTALELDMVSSKRFLDQALARIEDHFPNERSGSTNTSITTVQDRMLRSACQNSLVITLMLLEEERNMQAVDMVLYVAEPAVKWHTTQNAELRDAHRAAQWLRDQHRSAFMEHLNEIFHRLSSPVALQTLGMHEKDSGQEEIETAIGDELATVLGDMSLQLVKARMMRVLWMVLGYLAAFGAFLAGDAIAIETATLFRQDAEAFQVLSSARVKSAAMQAMEKRSLFQLTPVVQVHEALKELGWGPSPHQDIKDLIQKRNLGLFGTQIIEDVANLQKNHRQTKG